VTADSGRTAVYEAEEAAFGGTDLDDIRPIGELAAAATQLTSGEWWRGSSGPEVVVTRARRGVVSSSARRVEVPGRPVEIRLAARQATTATLTHELAHALAGIRHGHDGRFRAAHVDVCAVLGDRSAATSLQTAYIAFGVAPGPRCWLSPNWVIGEGFVVVR